MEENKNNKPVVNNKSVSNKPAKKKTRKKNKSSVYKATFLYILLVLGISAILSFVAIKLSNDMFAFLKEDKEIMVTIEEDASLGQVAKALDKNEVIEYGTFFKFFVLLSAKDSEFVPGTHVLNSNMDYRGVLNELKKTQNVERESVRVTIPEGYTIEQIATLMEEKKVVSRDDFLDTAVNHEFKHEFLEEHDDVLYQLEGYLFPDTYDFFIGDDPVKVINKMLNNFDNKTWELNEQLDKVGIDFHEAITIASLIEREAAKLEEQATISGVIHNRLNSSAYPFLNIDATIQYSAGHRENILQEDLDKDGPYNTYTRKGLPPGPIANPGLDAILAAITPETHDYYFYVAKPDGYHIFTKNLQEHNQAVAEARKMSK